MNKALADTCLRYLDGDLAAEELKVFNKLLVESPDAADLLSQLALDEQHYRATPAASEDDLLPALLKLEASAQPLLQGIPSHDVAPESVERSADDYRNTLTILADSGFWGYLASSTLRSKPAKWAGAAAILILAATLVFVFAGGPSQGPGVAETHTEPAATPATNPIVATLTATHNAQWAQQPREDLRSGDRLTLTAGFAEVTTSDGAIAILEAPTTVELLDKNNAIRLITGKLVGICETELSKGFLVRTPHMDVTDLGTRFGVDASQADATEVHVFNGEVQASRSGLGKLPGQILTKGQAVKAQAGTVGLIDIKLDAVRFASVQIDDSKNGNALSPDVMEAGITRLAGGVAWSSRPPELIPNRFELPAGKEAHVFAELRNHRLSADLPLTVHATGTTRRFKGITPRIVPAGTVIRSYFVCLNSGPNGGHAKSLGSIEFEGEVLGLICSVGDWQAFEVAMQGQADPIFKFARAGLAPVLEGEDSITGQDELFISDDRHTLSLMLEGFDFAEILRVIVLEPIQEEKP